MKHKTGIRREPAAQIEQILVGSPRSKHVFSRSGSQGPFHFPSPVEAQYLHMSNINVLIGALLERPEQPLSGSCLFINCLFINNLYSIGPGLVSRNLTICRLTSHHSLRSSLLLTLPSSKTFLAPAPSTTGSRPFPFPPGTTFGSNRPVWTKTLAWSQHICS